MDNPEAQTAYRLIEAQQRLARAIRTFTVDGDREQADHELEFVRDELHSIITGEPIAYAHHHSEPPADG